MENRRDLQEAEIAGLLYYARERQYRHVQSKVLELTQRHGAQSDLVLWKAYSLIMEGRESEGMRELEAIRDSKDASLAVKRLLVYAHKKCKIIDQEAVQDLESRIRAERTSCGERALHRAALYLWLTGRTDKSREYADRLLRLTPESESGLALRGWIDLASGRDTIIKKSIKYFDEASSIQSQQRSAPSMDVLLGKCRYYFVRHNFTHALELASQAVALVPGFIPALAEKMKVQLALQDWEQATETAQRCLSLDSSCVDGYKVLVLELLAKEGDTAEAARVLGDLLVQLDQYEPQNHWLYHQVALSSARLSGGNGQVLQQTMALVDRAISLSPQSSFYLNELAYQQLMSGKIEASLGTYKKAFSADETSVEALAGVIHCQLLTGQTEEPEQQLEFLAEIQSTIGRQAAVVYLNVLLGQLKNKPETKLLPLIQEARDLHIKGLHGEPLGCRYFELYNPQFLLWIAEAFVRHAPTEPVATVSQAHSGLVQATAILESTLTAAPAFTPALHLLARVKYLSGDVLGAKSCLQKCIKLDSSATGSHLLMAQINLHLNNPRQSQTSLEEALSHSFEIKSNPLFHLISGRVQKALGHTHEALTSLQTAVKLTRDTKSHTRVELKGSERGAGFGLSERATAYLETVTILTKLGKQHEAAKMMQDAIHEFSGTSEEFRVSIANSDLAIERGDVEQALATLKTVSHDKPYFTQAKQKMAEIYLSHLKDRKLYIACYRDLVERVPGPSSALLLGDALMNIQEPEEALSVYEGALKRNPRDSLLTSKVGQALVKTHQYTKAISYYEAALKSESMSFLRFDLATLYLRLGQFDRAEKTIKTALTRTTEGSVEVGDLTGCVDLQLLLAEVREKAGREVDTLSALEKARETQAKVVKRFAGEESEELEKQKMRAAKIASQLAEIHMNKMDWVTGLQYRREALLHCGTDERLRLALAKALLASGDLDQCKEECEAVLIADPQSREGHMLMGKLMFREGSFELAVNCYRNILNTSPDYVPALVEMIEVTRRAGRLKEASEHVEQAMKAISKPDSSPSLSYCRGCLAWCRGNVGEALQLLNKARRDPEWGMRALVLMVHLYINSSNDLIGAETFTTDGTDHREGSSNREDKKLSITTAQKLLKDARPRTNEEEVQIRLLQGWALLVTRSKADVEQALHLFTEMATSSSSNDSVMAPVSMATAHIILKQPPRARNQLKRIAKTPWNAREADWFEKGWLLLADLYVQTGKYDMAIELLKKCLHYNQACSRAWEYMGFISEKEQAYKDAATNYEKAWRHSHYSNPAIGYKLAFNYLKAKRLIEAINVCHMVLRRYPNYPRIERDIMDKARQGIRF